MRHLLAIPLIDNHNAHSAIPFVVFDPGRHLWEPQHCTLALLATPRELVLSWRQMLLGR